MSNRISAGIVCFVIVFPFTGPRAETALGVIVGKPMGVSFRLNRFPVLNVGWSFIDKGAYLCGDYWIIKKRQSFSMPVSNPPDWYIGAGVSAVTGSRFSCGLRVPLGMTCIVQKNIEAFGEIAPGIGLSNGKLLLDGGIGIRLLL